MRYKLGEYDINKGLDYLSFRNGIYKVGVQAEDIVKRQFRSVDLNNSGYLNWEQFLNLMVQLQAKTLENKINLFFQTADVNKDGRLSENEIFDLCKICLSKYLIDDKFLEMICQYYTKFIFSTLNIDLDDEIPLQGIKETILDGQQISHDDCQLLVMFCGADR